MDEDLKCEKGKEGGQKDLLEQNPASNTHIYPGWTNHFIWKEATLDPTCLCRLLNSIIVGTRHTNEMTPLIIRLHLTPYFSKVTLVTFDNTRPPRPEPAAPMPYLSAYERTWEICTYGSERQLSVEPLSEKRLGWDHRLQYQWRLIYERRDLRSQVRSRRAHLDKR